MERSAARSGQQMAFGGLEARAPGDRLFFAVYPDAQTAQRIFELARVVRASRGLRGNPIPTDRVHVTLHHLGDYRGLPDSIVAAANVAAEQIALPPFEVGFDRVASFSGHARKRPCVLRGEDGANEPLVALHGQLASRLHAAGLGHHVERRFAPHVTLLYDERTLTPEAVPPIGWTVSQFALVHSLLGRGEHRILGRWSLDARGRKGQR